MLEFEWDIQKASRNVHKHQITFEEASTVFADILSVTFPDIQDAIHEERYLIIGLSSNNRILVIAHLYRDETVRIISARQATKREQKYYELTK